MITIEQLFLIVNFFISISAILISYYALRRNIPHLEVKILECEHRFLTHRILFKPMTKTIDFNTWFQIKNLGNEGTTINYIHLFFKDNDKEYTCKRHGMGETKWINGNETLYIKPKYSELYEGNEKDKIFCIFMLYHTHGAIPIKITSQRKIK